MLLGVKLVLIMIVVGIVGVIVIMLLFVSIIMLCFNELEDKVIVGYVDCMCVVLVEYVVKVESVVCDYGDWNDSYDYMVRFSVKFECDSFLLFVMSNIGVYGMVYVVFDWYVVIVCWCDLVSGVECFGM